MRRAWRSRRPRNPICYDRSNTGLWCYWNSTATKEGMGGDGMDQRSARRLRVIDIFFVSGLGRSCLGLAWR